MDKQKNELLTLIQSHRTASAEGQSLDEDVDRFWYNLFDLYFVQQHQNKDDDLLFYVRKESEELHRAEGEQAMTSLAATSSSTSSDASAATENVTRAEESILLVVRRESASVPKLLDPRINWEESVILNTVLHQFQYKLAVAVCTRSSDASYAKLTVLNKVMKKLYPSPTKRPMDSKEGETVVTYPMISFDIDDYDLCFEELFVREHQLYCVQLVASDPATERRCTIFQGSVPFTALLALFQVSKGAIGALVDYVPGLSSNSLQFLKLNGPRGKGQAQVAVNVHQRTTSPSTGFLSSWMGIAPSTPTVLRACLTNVTLSCESILNDLIWK